MHLVECVIAYTIVVAPALACIWFIGAAVKHPERRLKVAAMVSLLFVIVAPTMISVCDPNTNYKGPRFLCYVGRLAWWGDDNLLAWGIAWVEYFAILAILMWVLGKIASPWMKLHEVVSSHASGEPKLPTDEAGSGRT